MKKIKKHLNFLYNLWKKITGRGFTLIELLVVIAIIALLASVVMVSISNAKENARRVTALANIKQMQKALELYYNDRGFYPPDISRGWDPGLAKALPYNATDPSQDCNVVANQVSCVCGT